MNHCLTQKSLFPLLRPALAYAALTTLCLLAAFTSVPAQALPALPMDANEALLVQGIGAGNTPAGFRWNLLYQTKVDDIEALRLFDISSGKDEEIISLKGKEVYAGGSADSELIDPSRLDWIYESGLTVKLFRLDIYRKQSMSSLYLPRTFEESGKRTHRMLLKDRIAYEKPVEEVRPYFFLDARKWELQGCSPRDGYTICQYALADGWRTSSANEGPSKNREEQEDSGKMSPPPSREDEDRTGPASSTDATKPSAPRTEPESGQADSTEREREDGPEEAVVQTILDPGFNVRGFLEHRKKKIMEHCKDPYFEFQEMEPGVIFLEGRHSGCGDRPAMDYLGIIRSGENEILDTRYIYPSPRMPEKNRKVWKAIFMRMIHGPDA